MHRLKRWEIALILSVAVTLLLGGGTPCRAWWGAVYPDASPEAHTAQTVSGAGAQGVELRFRTLEWLDACVEHIKNRGLR